MAVVGPGLELSAVLEQSWIHANARDRVWEPRIVEGQPVVRVLIKNEWWEIRLKSRAWFGGQRATYEKIVSGDALRELYFYRVPRDSGGDANVHSEIMCRIVAWLPRGQMEDARASQLDPIVPHIGEIGIRELREAIRANRVSFPSQVPTFAEPDRRDLQRKLAQLYFVLGWNCTNIGSRYGLAKDQVRQMLNTWKRRAVNAGYIQPIPPAEVMSRLPVVDASLPIFVTPAFQLGGAVHSQNHMVP